MKRIGMLLLALILITGCSTANVHGPNPAAPSTNPGAAGSSAPKAPADRVAFIRDGNLWVRPLDGSERKLTDGGGYSSPAFSPSGDWVLVRKGDQFWSIRTDGSASRQLPVSGRSVFVAWSPVDDRIAYRTTDQIGVLSADGSSDKSLVALKPRENVARLAWSPDGKWIGFDTNGSSPGDAPGTGSAATIRRVSPDDGAAVNVFTVSGEAPQCVIMAGWAADSTAVYFWPQPMCSGSLLADGTALMSVPVGGGNAQELIPIMLTHPDFLAVAKTGAIAVTAGGGRMVWYGKLVEVVQPQGAAGPVGTPGTPAASQVAPAKITPKGTSATSPAWSPDGRQVAYVTMVDAGPNVFGGDQAKAALAGRRIWIADADGKNTRQLTNDAGFRDEAPNWTKDGQMLFARLTPANQAGLWLIPAGGGQATQVAQIDPPDSWFGFYGWIDWSLQFAFWTAGK